MALSIRAAGVHDAARIWRLVSEIDTLDTNSCYAYLLLCSDFADTCRVACEGEHVAGFVAGYVPPHRGDVLFVWQIGVDSRYRGQGVARRLLSSLVDAAIARGLRYLEATITPTNQVSQRLFRSLAESRGWECSTRAHFSAEHFFDAHEDELLIRIGPFKE